MKMKISNYFGIIICGICLGILTGISISPIIQSIITSLITIIVTFLSLTAGINEGSKQNELSTGIIGKIGIVNIFPTTFFILFFTLGSFSGIKMRTANILGDNAKREAAYLKEIGFSGDEVKDIQLKKYLDQNNTENKQNLSETILFSTEIKEKLDQIRLKTGKQLETELRALGDPAIDGFLHVTNDSISIEALKIFLCTKK